jgi:hypothetical protein
MHRRHATWVISLALSKPVIALSQRVNHPNLHHTSLFLPPSHPDELSVSTQGPSFHDLHGGETACTQKTPELIAK